MSDPRIEVAAMTFSGTPRKTVLEGWGDKEELFVCVPLGEWRVLHAARRRVMELEARVEQLERHSWEDDPWGLRQSYTNIAIQTDKRGKSLLG